MKTLQDLQKRQKIHFKGKNQMTKTNAIRYLKLLHTLEKKYSQNLFTTELKQLVDSNYNSTNHL